MLLSFRGRPVLASIVSSESLVYVHLISSFVSGTGTVATDSINYYKEKQLVSEYIKIIESNTLVRYDGNVEDLSLILWLQVIKSTNLYNPLF